MNINKKGNAYVFIFIIIIIVIVIGYFIYNGTISFGQGNGIGQGSGSGSGSLTSTSPRTEPRIPPRLDRNKVEINANSISFYWDANDLTDVTNKIKNNANNNTRMIKIKTNRSKVTVDMSNKIKKFAMDEYKADVKFIQE